MTRAEELARGSERVANLERGIQQSGIREIGLRAHRLKCMSAMAGPFVVYVHLPKTGGSSQWHSIAQTRPPNVAIVDLYSSATDPWSSEAELAQSVAQRAAMALERWGEDESNRMLFHHHALSPLPDGLNEAPIVLGIREPEEVLVSAYCGSRDRGNFRGTMTEFIDAVAGTESHPGLLCGLQSVAIRKIFRECPEDSHLLQHRRIWPVSLGDYVSRSRIWEAFEWVIGAQIPPIHYLHTRSSRTTRPLSATDQAILRSAAVQELLETERIALLSHYERAHMIDESA